MILALKNKLSLSLSLRRIRIPARDPHANDKPQGKQVLSHS